MTVLIIVGGYVFYDAWKSSKSALPDQVSALAVETPADSHSADDPF